MSARAAVWSRLRVALLAWLAMLGLDFLLNGAVFAGMYQGGDTFMLSPAEAFRRIPLGYLAFLIVAFGIVEVAYRLGVAGVARGIRLGLALGGVTGAVWALSLYSIATAAASTALALAVIWLAIVLLGSAVGAAGLARASLRPLLIGVVAFDAACITTVIALQTMGVVPTVTM